MPRQGQIHYYTAGTAGNIVNQDDYKLNVSLQELRNENWQLTIRRYIQNYGWTELELFLTPAELALIRNQINGAG